MAKLERWEKYYLAAMLITVVVVLLLLFVILPGFTDFVISMDWRARETFILLICALVIGPFMLVYIIILVIKRKK